MRKCAIALEISALHQRLPKRILPVTKAISAHQLTGRGFKCAMPTVSDDPGLFEGNPAKPMIFARGVRMRLRQVLFAISAAVALDGCAHTIGMTMTESDQDKIVEAVLLYSKSHSSFLGMNKLTRGYLSVRGDDPSTVLLENLQQDGFAFRPGSEGKGDGYLVSIGPFVPTSPTTATGELSANSRDLGGAVENYTVIRAHGRWTVDGYQLLEILVVATPA